MVTVLVQLVTQPFRLTLSVNVNVPVLPAVTVTEAPFAAPIIVPDPLIVHECVTVPPAGVTADVNTFPVLPAHTAEAPLILQTGMGFTVTVMVEVL
jgi:hypothetical protein